jgi:hypothetical protein
MSLFGYGKTKDLVDVLESRYSNYVREQCKSGYRERYDVPDPTEKDKRCSDLSIDVRGGWVGLIGNLKTTEGASKTGPKCGSNRAKALGTHPSRGPGLYGRELPAPWAERATGAGEDGFVLTPDAAS